MSQLDNGTPSTSTSVALSRQAILSATSQCLAEVGYDGTTIRKIASTLGCAVGSIYRYFSDKRELLSIVCQQRFEPAAAVIEGGGSVEQSIRQYIEIAQSSPETYRLMFWLASVGRRQSTTDALLPLIVERLIAGWGRRLNHHATARQAWAVLHGSIMLRREAGDILAAARSTIEGTQQATKPSPAGVKAVLPTPKPVPAALTLEEPVETEPFEVGDPLPFRREEQPLAIAAETPSRQSDNDDVHLL